MTLNPRDYYSVYSLHGHVSTFSFQVNQSLQKKTINMSF